MDKKCFADRRKLKNNKDSQTISDFQDYLSQQTTVLSSWKICSPGLINYWNQSWAQVQPSKLHFYLYLNRTCNLNYWNSAREKMQKYQCRNRMSSAKRTSVARKGRLTPVLSNEENPACSQNMASTPICAKGNLNFLKKHQSVVKCTQTDRN